MASTQITKYDTLATASRSAAILGGLAVYGYYLVTWLGEQNLNTWGGNNQILAAFGIFGAVVWFALGIGQLFRGDDVVPNAIAVAWALPSAAVGWISCFALWGYHGQVGKPYPQMFNPPCIIFIIALAIYTLAMLIFMVFIVDEGF